MSDRDETLAGLAEVLGDVWDDGNASGLDGWVGPGRGTLPVDDQAVSSRDRATRKYAAVALAWLEGHGWAQGREEFGVAGPRDEKPFMWGISREDAERESAADGYRVMHRTAAYTPWEPVDGGA